MKRPISILVLASLAAAPVQERPPATADALPELLLRGPIAALPPATTTAAKALVDELARTPLADAAGVLQRILAEGPACVDPLERILRDRSPAALPGVRAAAATALGRLQRAEAAEDLLRSLDADEETATAAALALGDLRVPWTIPALFQLATTTGAPMPVRVAAAASALRGGCDACAHFLVAILGANLPGREGRDREAGLPKRDRWAFERELAISALAEAAGGQTFGFDENASHAALLASTATWEAWLRSRPAHPIDDPELRAVLERLEPVAAAASPSAAEARRILQTFRPPAPGSASRPRDSQPAQSRPTGG